MLHSVHHNPKNIYTTYCNFGGIFMKIFTNRKNNQALLISVKIRKYQHAYFQNYFIPYTGIHAI